MNITFNNVIFLIKECVERSISTETSVKVEKHEAELAAITIAEAFDVILRPVPIAQIQLCGHVVRIGIDVEQCHDLGIRSGISSLLGEVNKMVKGLSRTTFLYIARVWRHFKLVYHLIVPAIVPLLFPVIFHAVVQLVVPIGLQVDFHHGEVGYHLSLFIEMERRLAAAGRERSRRAEQQDDM